MGASEFTTGDGVAIRYSCSGKGPRVYLCQGGPLGDSSGIAAELSPLADEFTLVAHDYRGSGASERAAPDTYDFEHLADDLDQLRAHLGDDRIDVVAHSMGVPMVLRFA